MERVDSTKLHIRLNTKHVHYTLPDTLLAVEGTATCVELNSIVKRHLQVDNNNEDANFDFVVGDQFLRTNLLEHIALRGISVEDIIDIEYVERLPTPKPECCVLHDDWVGDVHVSGDWILTGCYDSTLHIWSAKGFHKLAVPGHSLPVKGVSWIKIEDNTASFVSVAQDQTANIWKWNKTDNEVKCAIVCRGHEKGVECVGVNSDKTKIATGACDNVINIWSTSLGADIGENEEGERDAKRSKPNDKLTRTPEVTLRGHKEAVSGLSWQSVSELVTSSRDNTLRFWDIMSQVSVSQIYGDKAFFDVDWSEVCNLAITACADSHVRLYDPRSQDNEKCKTLFTSHTSWTTSVSWSPTNSRLFISGSNDGLMKLWDTRSPTVPIFDMAGEEGTILCCAWSDPNIIVSGGTDNSLRIYNTKGMRL